MKQLPETFSYKTGNSGFHYYFWSKIPINNSISNIDDHVDIRGTNGYAIIPPSKNISGTYQLISNKISNIADLPTFFYDKILNQKKDLRKNTKNSSNKSNNLLDPEVKTWSNLTIEEIKSLLEAGTKIPIGVRNVVCFRLLSSFRAKGFSLEQLIEFGKKFKDEYISEKDSFGDLEIESIAKSVYRYPAYNNVHTKVNEFYLKWLEKNNIFVEENYKNQLLILDEKFFKEVLRPNETNFVSLYSVTSAREIFFKKNSLNYFSIYKPQLLAKKLKDLGFIKKRTSKNNVWGLTIHI